jgi:Ca2+-binding RTX toxin-like protein
VTFPRLTTALLIAIALLACAPSLAQAAVTTTYANQVLTVNGGKRADRVTVTCSTADQVLVNGRDPSSGPLPCSKVVEVDALTGAGNDRVDLSGIDSRFGAADFPGYGQGTGAGAEAGDGNDVYLGSPNAFNLFFGNAGDDDATGGGKRDSLDGGPGNDKLRGLADRDSLFGRVDDDHLVGGPGADLVSGGVGDDRLAGSGGADVIGGGLGMDVLLGGPGPDRLLGGPGRDRLRGGAGHDTEIDSRKKK